MSTSIPNLGYDRGADYPHVTPELFETASLIRIDRGEIIKGESVDRLRILENTTAITAPGTHILLPAHTLQLGLTDQITHKDRIAIIGIGSNCSPEVLLQKFQKAGIGGDFILAQANLENHTICHGAFLGGLGTVPATVLPHQGTTSQITVGFYTAEQAAALTGTEPNYDLVAIDGALTLRNTATPHTIAEKALLYVSIWGALKDPQNSASPIALSAIPQTTPLAKMNSKEIMDHVAILLGRGGDTKGFFNEIASSMPVDTRLAHNWSLAQNHGLAATIAGECVKKSTIAAQCEKSGLHVPEIFYK